MSMNVTLFRLPPKTLARIKKDAAFLEQLSCGEHDLEEAYDADARGMKVMGVYQDEEGEVVCGFLELATAWRDLEPHFSKKEPLLAKAILGDEDIHEDTDLGYGPGRLMSAAKVAKVAKILEKPAKGLLSERLARALEAPRADPKRKSLKPDEAENDVFQTSYGELCTFYRKAAEEKQAVLWTGA